MFCREEVAEAGMDDHVRSVHRITGLQCVLEQPDTVNQSTQTEEEEEIFESRDSEMTTIDPNAEILEAQNKNPGQDLFSIDIEPITQRMEQFEPNASASLIERYRCSKCDFYHNKKNFLKRHIHKKHESNESSCTPVKQIMKVVMMRKQIKKAIDNMDGDSHKIANTSATECNTQTGTTAVDNKSGCTQLLE